MSHTRGVRPEVAANALPVPWTICCSIRLQPAVVQGPVFEDAVESVLIGNGVALDSFAVVVV